MQSAAAPIVIGTPVPATSRICGRVFSAMSAQTNAIAYSIAQESVCSQRVSEYILNQYQVINATHLPTQLFTL